MSDEKKKKKPAPRTYMCKVCGHINEYVPRAGQKFKCSRCGYESTARDNVETV